MGWGRARYFHLTGQRLAAQELKDLGLVNEVMPRERLLPRAHELAEQMAKLDTLVLRYTRYALTAPLKTLVREHVPYSRALEALGALSVATRARTSETAAS
jgi:enoyl-CoA hydratase/carnithine racemase